MAYRVRLPRAFADESPHRFRVRPAHSAALPHFGVPINLNEAKGNEMLPAKDPALKRRNNTLGTAIDVAMISSCHTFAMELFPEKIVA
jgi:hypothetical protein